VTIETALPRVSDAPVDHGPGAGSGIVFPGAVVTTADGSAVRSVLHVHEDSMSWIAGWGAPLAVGQALLAAQLDDGGTTAATTTTTTTTTKGLVHPVLGERPQPDQMLELFQPGTPWVESVLNPLSPAVLALATSIMEPVPHGARVIGEGRVELNWLTPIASEDMRWAELTTTVAAHQDTVLGACLLLQTVVAVPDDKPVWCGAANTWITTHWGGTVVGGYSARIGGATFTSLVPLPLDRSSSTTGHVGFVGTCLAHHVDAVRNTVIAVEGASVTPIDVRTLSRGLQSLPHFYRDCGVRSGEVEVVVAESPETGSAVVTIDRVVNQPLLGADLWPLLAVNVGSGVGSVLRTRLTIPLTGDLALALRLVHATLVQPADNVASGSNELMRRTSGGAADRELEEAVSSMLDDGRLGLSGDGDVEIVTELDGSCRIDLQFDANAPHATWGATPTVWGTVIGGKLPTNSELGIGAWTMTEHGAKYTVALPPFALASPLAGRRFFMLRRVIREIADMCTSIADIGH